MKVLIVEEALKTLHGHWFQYISDIVNGGREAGQDIEVAVHKDACPEILGRFPVCHPVLNASVFEKTKSPKGKLGALKRVIVHNYSLYRDLSSFFRQGNSYDVVIATTPTVDHLFAYWFLFFRYRKFAFKKLVLVLIHIVGGYSSDGSQIKFGVGMLPLRIALWSLRPLLKTRECFLVTESFGLARQYKLFCGVDFPLVPHVTALPKFSQDVEGMKIQEHGMDAQPLLVGTFGFTRYDKGTDILQLAIKLLKKRNDAVNARYAIQWIEDFKLPDGSWMRKDEALMNDPAVEYLAAFTSTNQYYEWLSRTDIMVLPYRQAFYRDKLSRVAIDAVLSGMPIIYPTGTWLESLAKKYGVGVPFRPGDADSLADAISETVLNYPKLKPQSVSVQAAAQEEFSASAFFKIISKL